MLCWNSFLTTNRIGDFDEAFTSRIHISLYYPEFDRDKTIEIFNLNLKLIQGRFTRMKRMIKIDHDGIKRFADMHFWYYYDSHWNGHQIRNACQTALALAEYQAQQDSNITEVNSKATVNLTVNHFETVRDAYLEFTTYLSDLYGAKNSRLAEEKFLRVKENLDEEHDPFLTTEQLYKTHKKRVSQQSRPVTRQRRSSYGMHARETYNETQQGRPRQTQYTSSMRDRIQSELSSSPEVRQSQRLLRPQKFSQPQQSVQQQYTSLPWIWRESQLNHFRIPVNGEEDKKGRDQPGNLKTFKTTKMSIPKCDSNTGTISSKNPIKFHMKTKKMKTTTIVWKRKLRRRSTLVKEGEIFLALTGTETGSDLMV